MKLTCCHCQKHIETCKDGSIRKHGYKMDTYQKTNDCPGSFLPAVEMNNPNTESWLKVKLESRK